MGVGIKGSRGIKGLSLEERLERNRAITEFGCWEWTLAKDALGYGLIHLSREAGTKRVHIVAFELYNSVKPRNCVLHKLECSNKSCFNPAHLYDGTKRDNYEDAVAAGTHVNVRRPDGSN